MTTRYLQWTTPSGEVLELINSDRTIAYMQNGIGPKVQVTAKADCDMSVWLPDSDYTSPECDEAAWWFDDSDQRLANCMARVAGFHPTRIEGLDGSTTSRRTYDLIGDGAALGRSRRGARLITVTGVIIADTCCGATAFQRALNAKLEARAGGCSTDVCGGGELTYLECPPCGGLPDDSCQPSYAQEPLWVNLCNVALTAPVRNTRRYDQYSSNCGSCRGGHIREVTWSMVAGDPSLWWAEPERCLVGGRFDVENNYCNWDQIFHCCPTITVKQRQPKTACPVRVNRDGTLCALGWTPDANGQIPEDCYIVATDWEEIEADPEPGAADDVCSDDCQIQLVYNREDGTFEWAPTGNLSWQDDIEPFWDADREQYCGCTFNVGLLTTLAEDPDAEESPFVTETIGDYVPCCNIILGPPVAGGNATVTPVGWDPADGFPEGCAFVIDNVCPPEEVGPVGSEPCVPDQVCRIEPFIDSQFNLRYEPRDFELNPTGVFPPAGCIGFEAVGKNARKTDRLVNVEIPDPDCGCGAASCLKKPACDQPTAPQVPAAADPCAPCPPLCATEICKTIEPSPGCTEGVVTISVNAGARGQGPLFVKFFENKNNYTELSQFSECDACGDFAIVGLQKRTTFVHDGKARENTMLCTDGVTKISAESITSSSGNQWPVVTDTPLFVCILADATSTATKLMSVDIDVHYRSN